MKKFFKRLLLGLVVLVLVAIIGFLIFKLTYKPSHERREELPMDEIVVVTPDPEDEEDEIEKEVVPPTEEEIWQQTIDESDRVNVLLFGTDGQRADTLIFVSYSKKDKNLSMLTIPRDTKHEVEGMDALGQDKINAVFCFPRDQGGSDNQRKAIEEILNVPIHYYVKVNYNGLKAIVDTIGGVSVYVERDMNYDDRWADPELHIHLDQGQQVLDGDKAMQYIRWRKNNDGSGDSDIARTKRQQELLIKVVKKSFGINIADVINICYNYVRTDMTLHDLLYFGTDLVGFDLDGIAKYSLPGEADYRYFYQDVASTKELMKEIYE